MELQQNVTQTGIINEGNSAGDDTLPIAQDYYITYVAANGLSVTEDGGMVKISADSFAAKIGVNRVTLWRWQKSIPNFQARVRKRRAEIFTLNRENAIWHGLFLRAAKGDKPQAEMILSHFSDYVPPTQRHEVRVNGLADIAKLARKKNESHVVDTSQS
jgi:hypothetical protein